MMNSNNIEKSDLNVYNGCIAEVSNIKDTSNNLLEIKESCAILPAESSNNDPLTITSNKDDLNQKFFDFLDNMKKSKVFEFIAPEKFNELKLCAVFADKKVYNLNKEQVIKHCQNKLITCHNCGNTMSCPQFINHVCDRNTDHELNVSQFDQELNKLNQSPAISLMRENQLRLTRFIKNEMKMNYCSENSNKNTNEDKCTYCDRKFSNLSSLYRHVEKHELDLAPKVYAENNKASGIMDNTKFKVVLDLLKCRIITECLICGILFFDDKSALEHLFTHYTDQQTEETNYDECIDGLCDYDQLIKRFNSFYDNMDLRNEIDSSTKLFVKTINGNWMKTNIKLKKLLVFNILQCEFCEFFYSDVNLLMRHSAIHKPYRPFECFHCQVHYATAKEISIHWQSECMYMRDHYRKLAGCINRYYTCNVCDTKFPTLEILHEHRHTSLHYFPRSCGENIEGLRVSCEYCGIMMKDAESFHKHYIENHSKSNKTRNDKEIKTKRNFLCHVCGKLYTQSSHLWQHLRFHQGIKPFACHIEGCGRKFTIRPDLSDHIRKCHTRERPYHCIVCGKRFLTGSVFYQHRLIHRGERRYKCTECGKRFYRADALKNHLRIHTGEKPFGCNVCQKQFRQRGDLDKHVRARHPNSSDKSKPFKERTRKNISKNVWTRKTSKGNLVLGYMDPVTNQKHWLSQKDSKITLDQIKQK